MEFLSVIESTDKFNEVVNKVASGLESASPVEIDLTNDEDNLNLIAMSVFATMSINSDEYPKCYREICTTDNVQTYYALETYDKLFGHKGHATAVAFACMASALTSSYFDYWEYFYKKVLGPDCTPEEATSLYLGLLEKAYKSCYCE